MLHFNQRNWFRMSPDRDAASETLPEPRNRKEFYLSLLAGHTPTKKKVLFSGYGEYHIESIHSGASADVPTIVIPDLSTVDEHVTVMLGNQECQYARSMNDYIVNPYWYMYSGSKIWIHVSSEADAANKVVIFKTVELTAPQPKTATEFYLAKMARAVDHIEKVFEQEFTFGKTKSLSDGNYTATISNAYDETVDINRLIAHIDGNGNYSFNIKFSNNGSVSIKTSDASYAGTTHTLELFYKTVVEDAPVKTRTEQYLKVIAANQNSSDESKSSESGGIPKG